MDVFDNPYYEYSFCPQVEDADFKAKIAKKAVDPEVARLLKECDSGYKVCAFVIFSFCETYMTPYLLHDMDEAVERRKHYLWRP